MSILDFIRSVFRSTGPSSTVSTGATTSQRREKGTVTYRQDLGEIDAGGISLNASIEVRKFTEQEIRENAQDNKWYYEPAFWKVAEGVDADRGALELLLPELLVAHTSGSPRREQETVTKHLPEGTWRWAAYVNYLVERDKESYEEEIADINGSSLAELLGGLKVPELRAIYKEHATKEPGAAGSKKADIINAIIDVVEPDAAEQLATALRERLVSELEKPGTVNHRDMSAMFARRIAAIAYALRRRKQMLEISERYPNWRFVAFQGPDTPERCNKLDGKTFRFDDPFWDSGYPPCDRLDCACRAEVKMR